MSEKKHRCKAEGFGDGMALSTFEIFSNGSIFVDEYGNPYMRVHTLQFSISYCPFCGEELK